MPFFEKADETALGIFDVDETLVLSSDPAFQRVNIEKNKLVAKKLFESLTEEQRFLALNMAIVKSTLILIEPQTPAMLKNLQKKGVKVIALTGASPANIQGVALDEKREKELRALGIDFSSAFSKKEIQFGKLKPALGVCPSYRNGIIFANGDFRKNKDAVSKGGLLLEFLKEVAWTPKLVIAVDDKREHLEFIEESLRQLNPDIEFIGLHYTGAHHFPSPQISAEEFERTWTDVIQSSTAL